MENSMERHVLKIETIKTPEGNEVSVCPERGGIITSIKFKDKEILYMDTATLQDVNGSVKGGVPILFPNAGPLVENSQYPNLKQHGFARDSAVWKIEKTERGFKEALNSSEETKNIFPYDFRFSLDAGFVADGSFLINQQVENLGDKEDLPLSMGLHPYFKVPQDKKSEIKFNFEGGRHIEEQVEQWANGKFISVDNPDTEMEIVIPLIGTLILDISSEFKKIWVWSMSGKDFVCIEPVMRDPGGLINDPEKIKPKEMLRTSVSLRLKE